jgi:thioredoxin-dependent peroxiredoxin
MFSRSIRITPFHVLVTFAILALVTLAVSAAAPAIEPAEGNSPKPVAGQVAPTFSLVDQDGKTHKLADYKGKWVVLYFYPKDQTPGCTTQACNFTENVFAFRKAGAQILGVSEDDATSHKAFEAALSKNAKISAENQKLIEEHGLPFPLLADPTHDTAKNYGVLSKINLPNGTTMTIASRDTFLIDPNGKVVKHYDVTPDKLDGHSKEVLADIENFKAAKKG